MQAVRTFFADESAATAVEYAVMLGLILMVMITAIASFGQGTGNMWTGIMSDLTAAGF